MTLDPLAWNVPIVDHSGLPTPEFMRKWAQQFGINANIPTFSGSGILVQTTPGVFFARTITAGAGISVTNGNGGAGNPTITLPNTAVTPNSYGDGSHVASFTVDQQGRLTAAASVAIAITEANLTLSDVTTDNVSITAHGFAPKAPNDSTKFLNGVGAYSTPVGSGGGSVDPSPFSDDSITKPVAANFSIADDTTAGHGTGAVSNMATRGVFITETHGSGGATQSWFYEAAVSNTLVSMTAYLYPNFQDLGASFFYGIGVRDNAGKIHAFGLRNSGSSLIFADARYTTISALSSITNQTGGGQLIGRPLWMQLAKVGANFVFSVSMDGENYFTVETVSATAFVGSTLNDVGIFLENNLGATGAVVAVGCLSFTKS